MSRALHAGGTERQLTKTAVALDRSRFQPHVACFRTSGEDGFYRPELEAAGVPVVELRVRSFRSWSAVRGYHELRDYVHRHRIQLVHTFDVPMNIFGVVAARLAGSRIILSSVRAHRGLTPGVTDRLLRWSDQLTHGTVVNCQAMRTHLIDDYGVPPEKTHICYNGIDTNVFSAEERRRMPPLAGKSFVVGVLCVLRPEKNLGVLLEAFSRVRAVRQDSFLVIVGDGSERRRLEEQSRDLGLEEHCLFAGSSPESAAWMRSIDVFVLPSVSEALSNSLMEAMACGCAPVASRVGGNPELVEHGSNGLLFESGDPSDLARCIEQLATDDKLRQELAAASVRRVQERFSLPASAQCMGRIYEQLLQAKAERVP